MHDHLLGIGAVARASGLPASALRFYDAAGVLRPAHVETSGYRRYTADQVEQARIIARLRQVGMPLADVAAVLAVRHDPPGARELLDQHLRRLEDGLATARDHLADARALLAEAPTTRFVTDPAELAGAFAVVRHAVSRDAARPGLTGVLLDFNGSTLRLVATDRHRLAVATVTVQLVDGPPVAAIVPATLLDSVGTEAETGHGGGAATDVGPERALVSVALRPDSAEIAGRTIAAIAATFPDYRSVLRVRTAREVTVPASDLVARVAAVPAAELVAVRLGPRGVDVASPGEPGTVTFDREYLLEALTATSSDEVVLSLDAARDALTVAHPVRADRSLLMPVRLAA